MITQEQLEEKVKAIQENAKESGNIFYHLDDEDVFALLAWEMWKDGQDWDTGIPDIAEGKSHTREEATTCLKNVFGY